MQNTDLGKFSSVKRMISDWNKLFAAVFVSFPFTEPRMKDNINKYCNSKTV